jgi:hypothetical protein
MFPGALAEVKYVNSIFVPEFEGEFSLESFIVLAIGCRYTLLGELEYDYTI